jgi:hypothetical protein
MADRSLTSRSPRTVWGQPPRLSGGDKLRTLLSAKARSNFARLDSRGQLSPRGWLVKARTNLRFPQIISAATEPILGCFGQRRGFGQLAYPQRHHHTRDSAHDHTYPHERANRPSRTRRPV